MYHRYPRSIKVIFWLVLLTSEKESELKETYDSGLQKPIDSKALALIVRLRTYDEVASISTSENWDRSKYLLCFWVENEDKRSFYYSAVLRASGESRATFDPLFRLERTWKLHSFRGFHRGIATLRWMTLDCTKSLGLLELVSRAGGPRFS